MLEGVLEGDKNHGEKKQSAAVCVCVCARTCLTWKAFVLSRYSGQQSRGITEKVRWLKTWRSWGNEQEPSTDSRDHQADTFPLHSHTSRVLYATAVSGGALAGLANRPEHRWLPLAFMLSENWRVDQEWHGCFQRMLLPTMPKIGCRNQQKQQWYLLKVNGTSRWQRWWLKPLEVMRKVILQLDFTSRAREFSKDLDVACELKKRIEANA
jgi:hypothetical protein